MNLSEIEKVASEKDYSDVITVNSLTVKTIDFDCLVDMKIDITNPDLPVVITQYDQTIRIPNRDIPSFAKALALMCNENNF